MTSIKDLLDPEKVKHLYLGAGATDGDVQWDRVSVEEVQVTVINGIEFDIRGEAVVNLPCVDCGTPRDIEVAPKGADLERLMAAERIVCCPPCSTKRMQGKRGELVYVPITIEEAKQVPEINLTDYSPAELAAFAVQARDRMVAAAAAEIPEKRDKAVKAERKRVAKDEAKKKADRAQRKAMPGFTVKGKEVPALDLSEQSNLHETMSPKVRSPYNKVLNALGMSLLDPETTTWGALAETHAYLMLNHGEETQLREVEPKAKKKGKKGKKPGKGKKREVMVADLDPSAKAKIEAFAKVYGITAKQAEQRLVAAGVL